MQASSRFRSYIRLLNRFLRPYWKSTTFMVVINLLASTVLSVRFLALTPALETVMANSSAPAAGLRELSLNNFGPTIVKVLGLDGSARLTIVEVCVGIFIGLHVVAALLDILGNWLVLIVRNRIRRDMTIALHRHLVTLPISYFLRGSVGDLTSRVLGDVNVTASSLDTVTKGLLQSLVQILIFSAILMRTDYRLTGLVLAMGSIHMLVARFMSPQAYAKGRLIHVHTGNMNQTLMESYQGIRLIKSFAAERFDVQRISTAAETMNRVFTRARLIMHMQIPARMVADGLVIGVLVLVSQRYFIATGTMQISAFALFLGLAMQLVNPISTLAGQWIQMNSLMGGSARLEEIFAVKTTLPDGSRKAAGFEDQIELRDVTFEYEPGHPVLQKLNLSIRKGEMVAIVGPSGSGKSTLMDLILRFYDPTSGTILYDGTDLRLLAQRGYRRRYGVVSQESLLMNTTVRDNIVYGRPYSEEDLTRAMGIANATAFIRDLPNGLDSTVGDRGVRLSGGQRQRIAIARAVYADPDILILDEATSALDTESEREVQKAIDNVVGKVTMIVIAHRLSTIVHADRVVVLNGGLIEAVGPHAELLDKSRLYRRLYELQFTSLDELRPQSGPASSAATVT